MVVAVTGVRVVEVTVNDVIDMITVRDLLVTAVDAVNVVFRMGVASVIGSAAVRVGGVDGQGVFIGVTCVGMVEMTIVEVVNVPLMHDGNVSTAGTVRM